MDIISISLPSNRLNRLPYKSLIIPVGISPNIDVIWKILSHIPTSIRVNPFIIKNVGQSNVVSFKLSKNSNI